MSDPTDAERLAYLTYDAKHPETRRGRHMTNWANMTDAEKMAAAHPSEGLTELRNRMNARTADWPQRERNRLLSLLDQEIQEIAHYDVRARLAAPDDREGSGGT